jgi:TnpA family transposase
VLDGEGPRGRSQGLCKIWGAGDVASADGMRFTAPSVPSMPGRTRSISASPAGVTWYNLLSNPFSGLNAIVEELPVDRPDRRGRSR